MPEPVVTVAAMRARESRTWSAGISQESVIRRAGAAVARTVARLTHVDDPVLVLAGRGHNGGDAVAADDHLTDRDTTLVRLQDARDFALAGAWLKEWAHHPRALVLDGVFGIGLNRPPRDDWRTLIESVNASGVRVVSVDVPSGLDADTGRPQEVAIRATVTVTLGSVKRGLLRTEAAPWVGRLELAADIGLLPTAAEEADGELEWALPDDVHGLSRPLPDDSHKGSRGHVGIVAGSVGYHGAAVLAARGALRARPGLVTVFTDERCYLPVASQLQAAMVRPWRGERLEMAGVTAWVVGPGLASPDLSPAVRMEVERLWAESPAVVLADASALDWLPRRLAAGAGERVVTPHPGEAARRLGLSSAAGVQEDRVGALRRLAVFTDHPRGVHVVLKGRHTLVGGREGRVVVNGTGNPGLGQGGTGDVLAGFLGGCLAPPQSQPDLRLRLAYGVWRHGAVADGLEAAGRRWTAEDLAAALGDAG